MTTTVSAPAPSGNSEPSVKHPSLRIFAARLAYQMTRPVNPSAGLEMDVLLSFLEGVAQDAAPELAESLAEGVELAMRCGGVK